MNQQQPQPFFKTRYLNKWNTKILGIFCASEVWHDEDEQVARH